MIPAFILAKLYVKGSLKNNENGFEFALKNIIDSTMLTGIGPVKVGDKIYNAEAISLMVGEEVKDGLSISTKNPIPFRMGVQVKIIILGELLAPGENRISVTAISSDIGEVGFDIKDSAQV